MVGRLKPGLAAAQAEADANRVAQQIMRNYPPDATNIRIHPVVNPLQHITVLEARPLLRLLFWAVAVVLLIACANFAGLLLVRAIHRQRETAVRLALGATARTLLRQTVVESLVLSVTGGLIGIGLAAFAIYGGRNLLPGDLPLTNEITLNWTVAGFALLLAALTGVVCGLAPGFAALRTNVNAQMKEGGRSGSGSATHARLRSGLVVLEIAVALILLAAAGLLLRSFQKMSQANLGFEPDHVTTAAYSLPREQYSTQAQIDIFNHDLLDRLRQLPDTRAAGLASTIPMTGDENWPILAEGYLDPRGPDKTSAAPFQVVGDYFRAMGIPLLRGRYFTGADNRLRLATRSCRTHRYPARRRVRLSRRGRGCLCTPTTEERGQQEAQGEDSDADQSGLEIRREEDNSEEENRSLTRSGSQTSGSRSFFKRRKLCFSSTTTSRFPSG